MTESSGQTAGVVPVVERHELMGVPIAHVTGAEFVEWAAAAAATPNPQTCYGVNANSFTVAAHNADYTKALKQCDLLMCDGSGVELAARILPGPVPQRQIITDYHDAIHADVAAKGGAVFILGYEEGVAAQAAEGVYERHPGLRAVGHHHGFFEPGSEQEEAVIESIIECSPNVLWVGMGNPRQELFVMRHLDRLGVPLLITCGAMWKYDLGDLRRPPMWIRRLGIEWFYRCLTQGPVVWKRYTVGHFRFLRMLFAHWRHAKSLDW